MSHSAIRWRKVEKGHYRHAGTGVEIKFGFARLTGWRSSQEGWFVYWPRPNGDSPEPAIWSLRLREAQEQAADVVESMTYALHDLSYVSQWEKLHAFLTDLYGDDHLKELHHDDQA